MCVLSFNISVKTEILQSAYSRGVGGDSCDEGPRAPWEDRRRSEISWRSDFHFMPKASMNINKNIF